MPWVSARTMEQLKDEHGRLPAVFHAKKPRSKPEVLKVADGTHEDISYECTYGPEANDLGAYLVITLLQATPCQFAIAKKTPENTNLPWWRRLSIPIPTEIGDARFDAAYWVTIDTRNSEVVDRLSRPECQEAVEKLQELGFTWIRKEGLGVDAVWHDYPHGQQVPPAVLEPALRSLQQLTMAFGDAPPDPVVVERPGALWNALILIAIPFALLIGTISLMRTATYNPVGSDALRLLWMASLPTVLLAVVVLRIGHRLSRKAQLSRVKLWLWRVFAVVASVCCAVGCTGWANGAFDFSAPQSHVQAVVAAGCNEVACAADVESWRTENEIQRVPISWEVADRLHAAFHESGSFPPLEIVTKSGFLGAEWLVSQSVRQD